MNRVSDFLMNGMEPKAIEIKYTTPMILPIITARLEIWRWLSSAMQRLILNHQSLIWRLDISFIKVTTIGIGEEMKGNRLQ